MCLVTSDIIIKRKHEAVSRKRTLNTEEAEPANISIPTFPIERAQQQMDVTSLTSSELSDLKRDDPFMYYSISSVRSAALRGKDVDISLFRSQSTALQSSSVDRIYEGTVTRQRRVSTECHPDLLYADLFEEDGFKPSLQLESGPSLSLGDEIALYEESLLDLFLELNGSRYL
ncbi:hypothetical protein HJC23_013768 [Cyclotella cryptica]|uniref:Uncharacterized protein n=1 Tax=Cyclotella cryptica TaxID=29204 RepID=A0ABD3NV59_9STRA